MADGERTEFAIRKRGVLIDVRERAGGIWSVSVTIDESCAPDEDLEDWNKREGEHVR